MTKPKKAINEVNKMADQEILKAKVKGYIKDAVKWLDVEVYGYKRGKIIFVAAIIGMMLVQVI